MANMYRTMNILIVLMKTVVSRKQNAAKKEGAVGNFLM